MRKITGLFIACLACLSGHLNAQVTWTSVTIEASLFLQSDPINHFSNIELDDDEGPFGHLSGSTSYYDVAGNVYYELGLVNGADNFRLYINNQSDTPMFDFNPGIVITLTLPNSNQGQILGWSTVDTTDRFSSSFSASFVPYAGGTTLTLTQISSIAALQPGTPNAIDFTRNFSTVGAVPEPASAALLVGLFCAGLVVLPRRRRA